MMSSGEAGVREIDGSMMLSSSVEGEREGAGDGDGDVDLGGEGRGNGSGAWKDGGDEDNCTGVNKVKVCEELFDDNSETDAGRDCGVGDGGGDSGGDEGSSGDDGGGSGTDGCSGRRECVGLIRFARITARLGCSFSWPAAEVERVCWAFALSFCVPVGVCTVFCVRLAVV